MEENITNSSFQDFSRWKVTKSLYRTFQKQNLLSNRLKILQQHKSKKVKNIENSLIHHRKQMILKIDRYKHLTNIHNKLQQNQNNISISSHLNQSLRLSNINHIQLSRTKIIQNHHQQFHQQKKQHHAIDTQYQQQKIKTIQTNQQKRNKIKLMEFQSKNKLTQYWDTKLHFFRQQKIKDMERKLNHRKKKLAKLVMMQKIQKKLINEIKETDGLEEELHLIINQQKKLPGKDLLLIYR